MKENKDIIGACPKCGYDILEGENVFACSNKKDPCDFRVFKNVLGAEITVEDLNLLLEGSATTLKTMTSKKGNEFQAQLRLKSNFNDLEFIFPSAKVEGKKIGTCPSCGSNVLLVEGKYGKYYRCDKCDFKMGGEIAGKPLTEANAKLLLANRKTKIIKGFKSSKGNLFDATLVLDENNKIGFEFDN